MSPGEGTLARLGFGNGEAGGLGKLRQRRFGAAVEDAAASHDQRALGRLDGDYQRLDLARVGGLATFAPDAAGEERSRVVEGLGLNILAEGDGGRTADGGVQQGRQRLGQGVHDLFGAGDPVEIARHRPEAVVGRNRAVAEALDLLQHRIGSAAGVDVAGQEQHRQPVHMGQGGGGDHVGRAGTDGGGADHRPLATHLLGVGDSGVGHPLFVVGAPGRQDVAVRLQGLAQTGDIAVAEDGPAAGEIGDFGAIDDDVLRGQPANGGLGGGQANRGHGQTASCKAAAGLTTR
ncbi:hypothetical protein D3C72_606450 [compost metagenome]